MDKSCVTCKWFADGHYSSIYITPYCKVNGGDDAMFMRRYICGLEGALHEPKQPTAPKPEREGADNGSENTQTKAHG